MDTSSDFSIYALEPISHWQSSPEKKFKSLADKKIQQIAPNSHGHLNDKKIYTIDTCRESLYPNQ